MTPADVLFGQASSGSVTTLAINTGGNNLSLMCTTGTTGLGQLVVANVLGTGANYLYSLNNITHGTPASATISGFAIGHVAPVTLTPLATSFTISGNGLFASTAELQADPSGRFLTLTDTSSSLVHVLIIAADGTLSEAPGSPITAANALFATVGTTGQFLYVSDNVDGQISAFSINLALNPVLTLASTFVEPTQANSPISMLAEPTGTFLYTANNQSISFYRINPDGSLSPAANSPVTPSPTFNPQDLAMDTTGSFLYVRGSGTEGILGFTVTSGTGNLTIIAGSSFASGLSVSDMLINPLGAQLYVLISGEINVYTITPVTGELVAPTGAPQFASSSNLATAFVQ